MRIVRLPRNVIVLDPRYSKRVVREIAFAYDLLKIGIVGDFAQIDPGRLIDRAFQWFGVARLGDRFRDGSE